MNGAFRAERRIVHPARAINPISIHRHMPGLSAPARPSGRTRSPAGLRTDAGGDRDRRVRVSSPSPDSTWCWAWRSASWARARRLLPPSPRTRRRSRASGWWVSNFPENLFKIRQFQLQRCLLFANSFAPSGGER
jgi:hypothetical protein